MKAILYILGFTLLINPVQSKKAKDLRKQVQKKYQGFESFTLDFEQITKWEMAGKTDKVAGTILVKEKDLFRLNTPYRTVITDGKSIWNYSADNSQMVIDVYEENDDEITPRTFLYNMPDDYKIVYLLEEKIDGVDYHKMKLETENFDRMFLSITIFINKNTLLIQKVDADDINGNKTTYQIVNFVSNTDLPDSTFEFSPPDGTEIIDMRN